MGYVRAVAISHDDHFAVSAGSSLQLWDLTNGQCLRTFEGFTGQSDSVIFSPDDQIVLSGYNDGSLGLWDSTTGNCSKMLIHQWHVRSIAITPKARFVVSGVSRGSLEVAYLRLWDLINNRCLRTFEGHKGGVCSVEISPNGSFIASGGSDNTIRIWWLSQFREQPTALCLPNSTIDLDMRKNSMLALKAKAESALGKQDFKEVYGYVVKAMSIPGYDRYGQLLDLRRRAGVQGRVSSLCQAWLVRTFKGHTAYIHSVKISPDCRYALSGSQDKTVRLWDIKSGQCCQTFKEHTEGITSVTFLPGESSAMSGSHDNTLRKWDLHSGKCVHILRAFVWDFVVSPDNRFVLIAPRGGKPAQLWDIRRGQPRITFEGHEINVICVAISPDGRFVLSGGQDKTIRLWRSSPLSPTNPGCVCLHTFEGHQSNVGSIGFLPDGRFALSGSYDGTFRLWDLSSGICLKKFENARLGPTEFAISPDGKYVLSSGDNESAQMWELTTGENIRSLKSGSGNIGPVAFSADCRIAIFGIGHDLQLYELMWNYEFPEPAYWDEGAKAYLEIFLTLHCPYGPDEISRVGKPVWNDEDFKKLLQELQYRGYGWLRLEGVRKKLEEMTANWQGPPPLPGE
jgi:WD40 repeat protein